MGGQPWEGAGFPKGSLHVTFKGHGPEAVGENVEARTRPGVHREWAPMERDSHCSMPLDPAQQGGAWGGDRPYQQ